MARIFVVDFLDIPEIRIRLRENYDYWKKLDERENAALPGSISNSGSSTG